MCGGSTQPIIHDIVTVRGAVEVGYFRQGNYWFALARQFDIMGSGKTKDRAFRQLQSLVNDYVEACLRHGTTEFFSSCTDEEWEHTERHREAYTVVMVFARTTRQKAPERHISPRRIDQLTRYHDRLVTAGLTEMPCAV